MRVTVDDGTALEVRSAGHGPALLLVHGFGGAKEDFDDHVDALAATHRVVTFDHRGHGDSQHLGRASGYSFDRLATDTLAVARSLDVERFRLLGLSMGGMVAQRVVLTVPGAVEALVLVSTSAGAPPGIDPVLAETAAQIALDRGMERLLQAQQERGDDALSTPAERRLKVERPGYAEYGERKFLRQDPHMYAALLREIVGQADRSAALSAVACPTLVMAGEQDDVFIGPSERLAATIPGARLVVVPGAGHNPQFEQPTAWFDSLATFLATLDH